MPAGVVQRSSDLIADPEYTHRGFWREFDHPEIERTPYPGSTMGFRGYLAGARDRDPVYSEHTFEVLSSIVGMSDEEIAEGLASGAIG